MTGVSFIHQNQLDENLLQTVGSNICEKYDGYTFDMIYEGDALQMADVSYGDYPVEVIEKEEYVLILEGHIYDLENYQGFPEFINAKIEGSDIAAISKWLNNRDGEFLIYHVSKNNEILTIISDILGRIPIFYSTPNDELSVGGRSIHYIKRLFDEVDIQLSLDHEAFAQTLLLNNPFGRKTHFEEISQSGPSAYIEIDFEDITYSQIHEYKFDHPRYSDRSVDTNVRYITERIIKTCERRSKLEGSHILALSGGVDSRIVAAALDTVGCDFSSASFYTGIERVNKDVNIAMEISKCLGVDWNLIRAENTGDNMSELLYHKSGLNHLGMGFMVDFYKELLNSHSDPVQYYTGDVGALLSSSWSIYRDFESIDDAADWIIDNYAEMPLDQVAEFTRFTAGEIRQFVIDRLGDFPEKEIRSKVEHFITYERGFNLDFHGEDRNRSYFWTHAPLNSRPVVEYLLKCPRDQKRDYKLCIGVLENMNRKLLELNYVPYGAPIGSFEHLMKDRAYDFIQNTNIIRKLVLYFLFNESGYPIEISKYINNQLEVDSRFEDVFNVGTVIEFVDRHDTESHNSAYNLMTLTTLAEYVNRDTTTLAEYKNQNFQSGF